MQHTILRLASESVDVVIKTHPFAEILYWGPHLRHFSPQDAATLSRPVANGKLDVDSPVTLMAELGHGLFGSPGIEGHRQGLDGSPVFKTTAVEQQGQSLTVTAEDENAGLRLSSEIALDESGVLRVRHGVTNLRPQAWQVDRLAITLPVAERSQEVMAFHGRWIREFQPHRVRLEHDSFVIENRRGYGKTTLISQWASAYPFRRRNNGLRHGFAYFSAGRQPLNERSVLHQPGQGAKGDTSPQ
jgi:alpha-galactosidase